MATSNQQVSVALAQAVKSEGNPGDQPTQFDFMVTRSGATEGPLNVDWELRVAGTDPAEINDFAADQETTGTVVFGPDSLVETVSVFIARDLTVEADEQFTLALDGNSLPAGTTLGTASAVATISNDDPTVFISPSLTQALDEGNPSEDPATFSYTLTREGDLNQALTVNWQVAPQGDVPVKADDFGGTLPEGTVTFEPGESEATAPITFAASIDSTLEPDEQFQVELSLPEDAPAGTVLGLDKVSGRIVNDDAELSIEATDASKAEGDSDITNFTFTVTREGDTSGQSTVDWEVKTTAGDTVDGADFVLNTTSGSLTFDDGDASQDIILQVQGDTFVEPNEGFIVELTNPTNAMLGQATAPGTILNDDAQPEIGIDSVESQAEGDSGTTAFTVTLSRTGDDLSAETLFDLRIAGSGATDSADAEDFDSTELPFVVTGSFAANEDTATVEIPVTGDSAVEPDEGFSVQLENLQNGTVDPDKASAQATILNDDAQLSIAATDANKLEGDAGSTIFSFTVTRSGDTTGESTVRWTARGSDPNPADAQDAVGDPPFTDVLTFDDGETEQLIEIEVQGDEAEELNETFTVTLSEATNATIDQAASSATGTIQNDDTAAPTEPPVIGFDPDSVSVVQDEGDVGLTTYSFTLTRSGEDLAGPSAVLVGFNQGSTNAQDYEDGTLPGTQTVFFGRDETSKEVIIQVSADTDDETDESFALSLLDAAGAVIDDTASSADGTILDDDDAPPPEDPVIGFEGDVEKAEGNAGATEFTFTVIRSGDLSRASAAQVGFVAGDTRSDDFAGGFPQTETLFFAPDDDRKTVTIRVAGDTDVEDNETFTLRLQSAAGAEIDATASTADGTIVDDDDAPPPEDPVIGFAGDVEKAEGDAGVTEFTFTVTRSGDLSRASAAQVGFVAGDTRSDDFAGGLPQTQTVFFAPDEDSKTVTIRVAGDTDVEDNETFTLRLQSAAGAEIDATASSADGTILDDDDAPPEPPVLAIAPANAVQDEGDSGQTAFTFTVTRTGDTTDESTVTWTARGIDPNPADAQDAVPPFTDTLTFEKGITEKTITIRVTGDTEVELDETFEVTLSDPVNATLGQATATGTIQNDDDEVGPEPVVAIESVESKAEGSDGTTVFNVTLSRTGDLAQETVIKLTIDTGGADSANFLDFDEGELPFDIPGRFEPDQDSITVPVIVVADTKAEVDEIFRVFLETVQNGTVNPDKASAPGTIINDDQNVSVSLAQAEQPEEGNPGDTPALVEFKITRSGETDAPLNDVGWVLRSPLDGGAGLDDLVPGQETEGTVSFDPGATEQTVAFEVAGDTAVENDEGLVLVLSLPDDAPAGTTLGTSKAEATIVNDDTIVRIQPTAVQPRDEGTEFSWQLTREGVTSGTLTVDYEVTPEGTTDAADFGGNFPSGSVTFEDGNDTAQITFASSDDDVGEPEEGFALKLSLPAGTPAGTALETTQVAGVIANDDPGAPPELSIEPFGPSVLEEGDDGTVTTYAFLVNRSPATELDTLGSTTTVNWAVVGEGPDPANEADFLSPGLPGGTLTFGTNVDKQYFTVNVDGDFNIELDEGYKVVLSDPVNGTIVDGEASARIINDDFRPPPPTVGIVSVDSKAEGDDGVITDFNVQLERSGADLSQATTFKLRVEGVTNNSADGDDFESASFPFELEGSFAANEATANVTVEVRGDILVETNEGFKVTLLEDVQNYSIDLARASDEGTIISDDDNTNTQEVSVALAAETLPEGNPDGTPTLFEFVVTRIGETGAALDVDWELEAVLQSGTKSNDLDPEQPTAGTVSFDPGITEQTVTVEVAGDTLVEGDEQFLLVLDEATLPVGTKIGSGGGSALATIANDDTRVSIDPTDRQSQEEGVAHSWQLTREGNTSGTLTVDYQVVSSGTDPVDADDFASTLPSGQTTFSAGVDTATIAVLSSDDSEPEPDEGFELVLSLPDDAPGGTTLKTTQVKGTITDDDTSDLPRLSVGLLPDTESELPEGNSALGSVFPFLITRLPAIGGDLSQTTTVNWEIVGEGSNPASVATDFFQETSGIAELGPDVKTKVIAVIALGDTRDEPDEGFKVVLSDPVNGTIIDGEESGTILDDDGEGNSIYISDVQLTEGDSGTATEAVFTVSLSTPVDETVTVDFSTADGTAEAGTDYTAVNGTLTFAPGETVQTITVPVSGDDAVEPNESFFVNLSNPVNDVIADGQGEATILDDDGSGDPGAGDIGADEILDGTDGDDVLQGGNGDDALSGLAGDDALSGRSGDDTLDGGAGDDILAGGSGDDTLTDAEGDDVLGGGSGNDVLEGGAGDDSLAGGSGDDQLSGGAGNDALVGGSGYDSFVFRAADGDAGHDTIRLFNPDEDTLRFEEYGERLNAFSDLDTNANGVLDDDDAHVSVNAGDTVIDLGGQIDGASEGSLKLVGVTGIEADDMSFS